MSGISPMSKLCAGGAVTPPGGGMYGWKRKWSDTAAAVMVCAANGRGWLLASPVFLSAPIG